MQMFASWGIVFSDSLQEALRLLSVMYEDSLKELADILKGQSSLVIQISLVILIISLQLINFSSYLLL